MDRRATRPATILAVACAALAAAVPVASAKPATSAAPAKRGVAVRLQRTIDQVVAAGAPGVVALVREHGRTIRLAGGYADTRTKTRMRPSDRFRVGSVTKTFVATVILQLSGEGRLSLDDDVERWLPGEVPGGAGITVRQLLNMTSGLYDYLDDGDGTVLGRELADPSVRWAPADLVAIATAHAPHFAPGTSWSYSNTGYIVLGQIAEKASGQPIGTLLRDRIFTPVGLRATSFETGPRIAGRHAHGYDVLGGTRLRDVSAIDQTWAWTAGAVVSDADDLARFYRAVLAGRLLRPDLLRTMETTVPMGDGAPTGYGYGAGIYTQPMPCGTGWGHNGSTPGYLSNVLNSRSGARQAVILLNGGEAAVPPRTARPLRRLLSSAYCGA